jgi:D-3-phosphoglycerate dehydrogenase
VHILRLISCQIFTGATRQEFLKACEDGSYSDVVAIYRSNESTSVSSPYPALERESVDKSQLTGPFDAELVSKLPSSMKYICHNGAGYDNIDVAACTSRSLPSHPHSQRHWLTSSQTDIQVAHTPQAVNAATADIAIFLMLGALRRIHVPYTAIRSSNWRGSSPQLGYDPQQKVLGIVGMGGIGREVAARARAFGMSIQYFNRSKLSPELEKDAKYVSFEELLKSSDVISLNCSLTKETVGLVGKKEFALMKKGVIIVNTARGKLIDEQALVDALEEGKVFSAGLDVYEEEPKVNEGLLNNPNVVLLPHVGTSTWETQVCLNSHQWKEKELC